MANVGDAVIWWLVVQVLGLAALPLAFRLFRWLPDRGYAFSKALGLLLTSYLFWLLTSLGFLRNSAGGVVLSAAIVALLAGWVYRRGRGKEPVSLSQWLSSNRRLILAVEILFVLAFAGWALVRSFSPEITGTEKPMDLAFINAISRSEQFPPVDPWLSGFAISYYYFGYLIIASVAKVAGVTGSVAFNVGLAWQFAGTLLGAFGIVYNLVAVSRTRNVEATESGVADGATPNLGRPIVFGLLGSLLVGVMGNLEGLLDVLHANQILPAGFWQWLDIEEINLPAATAGWPSRPGWWWWRASRVIHDHGLAGETLGIQPIAEFPFFSFLLGDMHPHVLALPFVFVALGLALNWWLKRWEADAGSDGSLRGWLAGFVREVDPIHLAIYAVCLGALGFLNTWDFPIYLFVTVGAFALAQLRDRGRRPIDSGFVVETWLLGGATVVSAFLMARQWMNNQSGISLFLVTLFLSLLTAGLAQVARRRWQQVGRWAPGLVGQILLVAVGLLLAGVLAYLPFYIGFRSQAAGLLPYVFSPTRLPQFLVIFGPFLFIQVLWLGGQALRVRFPLPVFFGVAGGLLGALLLAATILAAVFIGAPQAQDILGELVQEVGGLGAGLREVLRMRLTNPWTALFLLAIVGGVAALWRGRAAAGPEAALDEDRVTSFVLLLVLTAALLTLAPEFVYLRDIFMQRMNTVFKFYYQAWVLLAVSSAFALGALLRRPGALRWVAAVGAVLLIGAGLVYPVLAIDTRTNGFQGRPTLDGMAYMATSQPGDYEAIRWLQENVVGRPVVLEAVGPQYSSGGRIAAHTGLPTVLGWAGHEHQWRGTTAEPAIREPEITTLYTSRLWQEVTQLLDKYDIEYIVVGPLEVSTYGQVASVKFERALETVFQAEGVTIYRWESLTE